MINMNRHVLLSESLQNLQGRDPAVPADLQGCPGWLYAAMPSNLRKTIDDVARKRIGTNDKPQQLLAAVPDLASMALPSRSSRDVSVLWGLSPPIGVLGCVVASTLRLGKLCGVDVFEERSTEEDSQELLRSARRPAHHASIRLDSLDITQITRNKDGDEQDSDDGPMCAICQIDFEADEFAYTFKQCKHAFHVKCLNKWLERGDSCPCCRCKLGVLKDDAFMLAHLGQIMEDDHVNQSHPSEHLLRMDLDLHSEETTFSEWVEHSQVVEAGLIGHEPTPSSAIPLPSTGDRGSGRFYSADRVQKEELDAGRGSSQLRMPCVRVDDMAVPCGSEEELAGAQVFVPGHAYPMLNRNSEL